MWAAKGNADGGWGPLLSWSSPGHPFPRLHTDNAHHDFLSLKGRTGGKTYDSVVETALAKPYRELSTL